MVKKLYILIIFFTAFACRAQEVLSSKVAAKRLTSFHFTQFSGGVMVVRAKLNDLPDSLNFILDTGSGGISLDSTTCEDFKIANRQTDTVITGMGGEHRVRFAFNQKLKLPGLTVENLNFHINDYAVLSSVYGERIDGIIGYSFFSRYIVKINFDSTIIEVYSQGDIKYPRIGTMLHPLFTNIPILPMNIKDRHKVNFNFYFDTGAGLNILLNEDLAKDSNILLAKRKPVATQAEGMGGRLQMRLTVLKQVQVGPYKFKAVPTLLFKDEFNVTAYPSVGGLLGNDILRRFNLTINYAKKEIHLSPNSHFNDVFDYSYTGMAVYFLNGRIIVDDVIPGSPADKAGLQPDDVIVGVNNNIKNNIQEYKVMLQAVNQKVKLIVERAGELHELHIRPQSILK